MKEKLIKLKNALENNVEALEKSSEYQQLQIQSIAALQMALQGNEKFSNLPVYFAIHRDTSLP